MLVRAPYWFNYDAVDITIWREGLTDSVSSGYLRVFTLLACVPIALGAIYLARRFRDHPLGRRPVLAQHILCFLLIGLAASNLLGGMTQVVLWSVRSEEHTSEFQSLMRISYAVFCLKKNKNTKINTP